MIGRSIRFVTLVLVVTLIVRAFFLESFTVTTGSMAPFLLGVHRQCDCPKCGFPVVVGAPPDDVDVTLHWQVKCPNCGQGNLGLEKLPDRPGQWLLVDKNVYEWRSPRRWELMVFRGPSGTPFIKRVIGLPGETVQIKDGDVYIDGEIARKPYRISKEMSFLIYDGQHPSEGWWKCDSPNKLETGNMGIYCVGGKSVCESQLPAFYPNRTFNDYCVYNGARVNRIEPVFDFRLCCFLRMAGTAATSFTAIKINNGRFPWGNDFHLEFPGTTQIVDRMRGQYIGLTPNQSHEIDIIYYDGMYEDRVDRVKTDREWNELGALPREDVTNPIRVMILNADVDFQNIRVFRDTHYQSVGRHGIKTPCRLGPDEFFVLGDNSAVSDDSRMWPEPGVKRSAIIGRPIR